MDYYIYPYLLKKVILPLADTAMKTDVAAWIRRIRRMNQLSREEVISWQNQKLKELVLFAYHNTSYYRRLFDDISLDPNSINSREDLAKIPILRKEDVIQNYQDLIPENINEIPHKRASTGGSSGDPMVFILDLQSWSFTNANNIVNWERTKYRYGNKFIALGSTSINVSENTSFKHKVFYYLKNKISLSGVNMSDEVCRKYLEHIKRDNIKYIYGYASAIYLLASYAERINYDHQILSCFPTSEILTPIYRDKISKVFKCDIVNCYGASDGGITAFEHNGSPFEVGYNCLSTIEGDEENGPALYTDLLNFAMPMINYKIGDEIQLSSESNLIYNGQLIKKLMGRTSDVIRLENGNVLTGPGFTILFKDMPVKGYSINKVGVNQIECRIQPNDLYTNLHENIILESIKKQSGSNCDITLKHVDKFENLKSGKKQYFIVE